MSKTIPMAICYDFDDTLAPGNMQEYNFFPALGLDPEEFWDEANHIAERHDSEAILSYMKLMLDKAKTAGISIRRNDFRTFGAHVSFFPGVEGWFSAINGYAASKGVSLEHFIISSGLREMIEGTAIASEFTRIYAAGFMYDDNGEASWPALAVNYTTKTQYLFRINKGSLDVFDDSLINKYVPKDERRVPFRNMIYIGDGETDIPCFRVVKDEGGHSIAVYQEEKSGSKPRVQGLLDEGRATIIAPADYRSGSIIDSSVRAIIDKVEAESRIGGA